MSNGTFFKFMGFGPHTRLSLYMLFKHKSLFFAYKNVLNDPTDCSPYFYVELEDSQLERRIKEIAADTDSEHPSTTSDAVRILELFELDRGRAPSTKSAELRLRAKFFQFGYFQDEDTLTIARKFIAHHMRLQVDEARIFSMSKRVGEPRLWAHYANSHSGLCIELDGIDQKSEDIILDRVDYTTRRPRISVADIKGMKSHEKTRSEIYNRMFFQKSTGWDYEDEQRLVMPRSKTAKDISTLSFPEGDYIPFPKLRVKCIYFGMNCDMNNIEMTSNLIEQFYTKGKKPNIFKATQSEDNYEISFEDPYIYF